MHAAATGLQGGGISCMLQGPKKRDLSWKKMLGPHPLQELTHSQERLSDSCVQDTDAGH